MMYGYGAGFGGGLWMLGGLLLVVGVLVLIVWLVGRSNIGSSAMGGSAGGPGTGPAPLDILRERYARGEISDEEFERRRKVLGA